jgi:hypothetical protein
MFDTFLPRTLDNSYRGHKAALWLFGLVVAVRIVQSLNVMLNGYSIAVSADGLPLDSYPPAAAQNVVAMFSHISLWRLTFAAFCALVLVRYRTAIPLMFSFLIVNYLGARLLDRFVPTVTAGAPPGPYIGLTLTAMCIIGLLLSLRSRVQ